MNIIKEKLDKFILSKKIPHILFHGESIQSNISNMRYILDNIYSTPKDERANTIYVNCAYGKGIKFIREQLKFFARTNISIETTKDLNVNNNEYKTLNFKSIILVNADFLTIDAQSALRRCIELYSHTTRFFMVVINKDAIIKPIISRFCDIYIPSNNKITYNTITSQSCRASKQRYLKKIFKQIDDKYDLDKNMNYLGKQLFKISNDMYDRSLFYYDFIEYFKTKVKDDHVKYILITYINKIRGEIKNEKLLILNILNIYCMRHSLEIENIYTF